MPDLDTPTDALEQEVLVQRAALSRSLSDLARATNLTRTGDDAMSQMTETAQELATSTLKAARANPAGLALVGLGLAVLALPGRKPTPGSETPRPYDARVPDAEHRMKLGGQPQRPSAAQMRARLDRGLDDLGAKARERVKAARLKAVEAQEALDRQASQLGAAAVDTHQTHPLLSAAIAAGIGGLVGALLPGTRHEDRLMGDHRDATLRDAEAVLREEMAKLTRTGAEALSDRIAPTRQQAATGNGHG